MLARKLVVSFMIGSVGFLSLSGCLQPSAGPTQNQGGSDPVRLGIKLANITAGTQDLSVLNPDDLQVMVDLAADFSGEDLPELSDALAGAAIDLMNANNIETFEDLANIATMDPESIVIPEGVDEIILAEIQALFGDINDPNLIGEVAKNAEEAEI